MIRKTVLILALAACSGAVLAAPADVKIINVGSHFPSLEKLKADIDRYENEAPFDGATFLLGGSSDVFNPQVFTEAQKNEMRREAKIYQSIPFKKWKYNFLSVLIDQHVPQWFDDTYWENVTKNWFMAARIARKLKFVGISFDPEGYGVYPVNSHWKSEWWLKGGKGREPDTKHTEKQYLDEARRRGRQIGEAVFKEYPEMVLWSYYFWSFGVDMMGAFCNGLMDALPPKARMIDGDEWTGYCAKNAAAYERMQRRSEEGCGYLDKKYRSKQRAQGGFSPPFYVDAYAFPDSNDCLRPTILTVKSRTRYFAENLKEAKQKATGGFIWIYGEKHTWWPPTPSELKNGAQPIPSWESDLPGIGKVLFSNGR